MKFKVLKRRSEKSKQFQRIQDVIREILKIERGAKCELCGRTEGLGVFHILPVSTHPRIRFNFENVLLTCWQPCHFLWHHNFQKAQEIEKKIKLLRGNDYRERLETLDAVAPKLTAFNVSMVEAGLNQHLRRLSGRK